MSFPYYIKGEARVELGRKWGLASAAKRQPSEPDDYTLRRRAEYDARGQIEREGCTYRASGVTHWQMRRAVAGRTDQHEFVANGRVKLLGGRRLFPLQFRPL